MSKDASNQTPLMRQYWEIKTAHTDKILLFRMGDFYEMFFDDAITAAPILGIALTQRNKKSEDQTPMCGMPHHSVAGPINKLLAHGLKVAICDQIEDPKTAKGIVKRAVTRVLTPGMVYDSDTLDCTKSHYLASFDFSSSPKSISFIDTTTGEAFYYISNKHEDLLSLLDVLPVAELVIASDADKKYIPSYIAAIQSISEATHAETLKKSQVTSAARLMQYVLNLAQSDIAKTLRAFEKRDLLSRLEISSTTFRHLEVFQTYKGDYQGTLFKAINRTQTSIGSRLLRQWISFPLKNQIQIEERQEQINSWQQDLGLLKQIRTTLSGMGDIERRLAKISAITPSPRDVLSLAQSLRAAYETLRLSQQVPALAEVAQKLANKIENILVEEPPLSSKQGYVIRKGVDTTLDELIDLSTHSHDLIQKMENDEKQKTGISSLKIRYNNVFGYYIEITNAHKEKALAHYTRKQTLANAERYCTDALIELERKVLSAQTKRSELESQIFEELRNEILAQGSNLLWLARVLAELDVITSLAWLAIEQKYVRPQFAESGLKIIASRHPVIEQEIKAPFIANDIELGTGACLLLTGPNMAGKSTLMRQVAVTVMLAQMGSFVPAESATLPLFDRLFTRIGASDQLSEGLSTFMVEMKETAEMLKNATEESLVILDEVGRGTATFDGMSLAQSILEFLLTKTKCMTFFATHYHELTNLENYFAQVKNGHMTVVEQGGQIQFLHTLVKGPALKSYGIHVAKLAGLPKEVTQRAQSLLKDLEGNRIKATNQLSLLDLADEEVTEPLEEPMNDERFEKLKSEIKGFNANQMTPLEALNQLVKLQQSLS